MSKSIIQQHYLRILSQWPTDLLRPNVSFQKTLQSRIDSSKSTSVAPEDNVVANGALASVPPKKGGKAAEDNEKGDLEQINALYSFLEDRYARKYPLSEKMRRPASNPDYYDNLMKELEEAPRRSWIRSVINRWKSSVRWS